MIKGATSRKNSAKGSAASPSTGSSDDYIGEYHKGGKVRKSGIARLKKGERVLTKKQSKKYTKKNRGK